PRALEVEPDPAVRGAGLAGDAVVRAEVALFALFQIDAPVAAEVREPAAGPAPRLVAVGRDVPAGAIVTPLRAVGHAVAAVTAEVAARRAVAVEPVVVVRPVVASLGARDSPVAATGGARFDDADVGAAVVGDVVAVVAGLGPYDAAVAADRD